LRRYFGPQPLTINDTIMTYFSNETLIGGIDAVASLLIYGLPAYLTIGFVAYLVFASVEDWSPGAYARVSVV